MGSSGTPVTLTAYYLDNSNEDVTGYAEWRSSNIGIATVNNGVIAPVSKGTAYVYAKYLGRTVTIKSIVQ